VVSFTRVKLTSSSNGTQPEEDEARYYNISRKDMTMSEEAKPTAQELKQSILDRMDAAREEVENLSEEELESIAGGGRCSTDAKGESSSSCWTIPPPQRPKHDIMPYKIDHLNRNKVMRTCCTDGS
jgi:hypothetical protein